MLQYLKWFSIAGVWYPIAVMAAWALLVVCASAISPAAAGSFYVMGIYLAFALCHALPVATLFALGLWATRRAPMSLFALLTALLGALIPAAVLGRIYVNAGV
jgi:hypothetical protein